MKKDIFIDTNIACKFSVIENKEDLKLVNWLLTYDSDNELKDDIYAYLVVSKKLLNEYLGSSKDATSLTNIANIIGEMQKQGRLSMFSKQQIEQFQNKYFKKHIKLRSNKKDWDHIPIILMSDRKYVLTLDENFTYDLLNFPGYKDKVGVEKQPENLPYDE